MFTFVKYGMPLQMQPINQTSTEQPLAKQLNIQPTEWTTRSITTGLSLQMKPSTKTSTHELSVNRLTIPPIEPNHFHQQVTARQYSPSNQPNQTTFTNK